MLRSTLAIGLVFGGFVLASAAEEKKNAYTEGEPTKVFVGIEAGATMVRGDSIWGLPHEGENISYGIRLGAQNNEWRSMVICDYFDSNDDDQTYIRASIQADYYFLANDSSFKPYVGVNGGFGKYKSSIIEHRIWTYGGQAGINFDLGDNLAADVGYRYSASTLDELDHIDGFVGAISYTY